MKVHYVKIIEADGPEELFIKASSIIELIEAYQMDLVRFPRPQNRTDQMNGMYGAMEQIISHLKELLPK